MSATHDRCVDLPFTWPDPPFHLVLVEPTIPPNTGTIARLCAATRSPLILVEPLGFDITDTAVKRAGLDYWKNVDIQTYPNLDAFLTDCPTEKMHFFSTAGTTSFFNVTYNPGDYLVFGSETAGLPDHILETYNKQTLGLPIVTEHVRSLNLANTASIALYEALRQVQD